MDKAEQLADLLRGAVALQTDKVGRDSALQVGDPLPPAALDADVRELVQTILLRERARENLIDFATFIDPTYEPFPFHRLLARKLEDIEAGRLRRLAIFVPPASGKSRLASELFPAWFLGRNPSLEFIQASYDFNLARGFGRNVRNSLKEPQFKLLFPDVELAIDATAMDEWKTSLGGEYKAEGVGGGLIGFHAHVAVVDDPVKDYGEAASPDRREAVWNWYSTVLLNRLRSFKGGPGAVILIMQRWHDDDLGGRIEKLQMEGQEAWEIISLPSIAEEGDQLGRNPGEPLLPEGPNRRPLEELQALRARNPRLFMALHQQKPVADEGDLFHTDWLRSYVPGELPKKLTVYITSDFAMTDGGGDYSVLYPFGVCPEGHVWLLDRWKAQVEISAGVEKTVDLALQWQALKVFVEKTSMTKAYGPLLAKRRRERGCWTLLEEVSILGRGGKDSPERAGALAGAMQLGYIHVPAFAGWLGDLQYTLARFPNGTHDDDVDALALIGIKLAALRGKGRDPAVEVPRPLEPRIFTFDEAREQISRRRLGRRTRRFAIVLPNPPKSVLDEAA